MQDDDTLTRDEDEDHSLQGFRNGWVDSGFVGLLGGPPHTCEHMSLTVVMLMMIWWPNLTR